MRSPRLAVLVLLLTGAPPLVEAQEGTIPGLAEWSDAVVDDGHWTGPRVPYPSVTPRPVAGRSRASLLLPVTVHAEAGVDERRIERALSALELAWLALESRGWPTPPSDGGRDGTDGFDLFLRNEWSTTDAPSWVPTEREPPERFARAGFDAMQLLDDLDAALTFAEVYAGVPDDRLEACVTSALIEAALLSTDPAEAISVRRATATYLTQQWTGELGCDEGLVVTQALEPTRGIFLHDPSAGEGGALFLASLSARHDEGTGDWLRDVWNAARQRTPEGELHAVPDVPWMLVQATELTYTPLVRSVVDFAASRWFGGRRRAGARLSILRALPDEATIPAWIRTTWARLPRRLLFADEGEVEPYGTAYAVVDVRGAPPGSRVQVWMEGEYGVEWSLVGMRVDRRGHEISRTRAPARDRDPHSYLSIELLEGTVEVVLAVTNLSGRGPDADEADDHARSFRLTVDSETE